MKLLVAVDFSPGSQRVTAFARKMAAALRGETWLLHVADPDPDFVGYEAGPQVERDLGAGDMRQHHRDLQNIADEWRAAGLNCTALLVQGPTNEKILSEALRMGADLIVLGSHSTSVMKRWFVGSTSDQVLHHTQIPVLVVPSV